MATKQGQKQEAARQELLGELTSLRAANLKADGNPKTDAVPQELARIKEIERNLGLAPNAGLKIEQPAPATEATVPQPAAGETDAQKIKRLTQENKELLAKQARGRDAAKIKLAAGQRRVGYVKRPDEYMNEGLAIAEDTEPANWGENIKLAVERTIRRFVRKGGARKDHKENWYDLPAGFKKGVTFEEKVYTLGLLEKLGRITSAEDIIKLIEDRKNMPVSKKRQTAKEFNKQLEALGVSWDDEIQVPGMSATAKAL